MVTQLTPHDAFDLYCDTLEAEGYVTPSTLRSYRVHIGRFLRDIDPPATIAELNARHAMAWTKGLVKRGLKPGGIRSYQSSVWIWFGWLNREGYNAVNIADQVRRFRKDEATVTRRSAGPDLIDELVACARSRSEWRERNPALVLMLVASGARAAELAACYLEDYDAESGTLDLHRHTKSNSPRIVGVDRAAALAMTRYVKLERGNRPGPLFLGRMARPLSKGGIQAVVKSLAMQRGLPCSPHDFRRACANRLLDAGANPWTVQHQLGHSTDWLTKQYAKEARARAAIADYHRVEQGIRPLKPRRTG